MRRRPKVLSSLHVVETPLHRRHGSRFDRCVAVSPDWTDGIEMDNDDPAMTRLRRLPGHVAVVWLLSQLASAALVPLAVWADPIDVHGAACTCTHGANAACPMHRNTAASPKTCALQSTAEHSAVLFTSLFGITGIVPARTPLLALAREGGVTIVELQMTITRPGSPDPPPPRT